MIIYIIWNTDTFSRLIKKLPFNYSYINERITYFYDALLMYVYFWIEFLKWGFTRFEVPMINHEIIIQFLKSCRNLKSSKNCCLKSVLLVWTQHFPFKGNYSLVFHFFVWLLIESFMISFNFISCASSLTWRFE